MLFRKQNQNFRVQNFSQAVKVYQQSIHLISNVYFERLQQLKTHFKIQFFRQFLFDKFLIFSLFYFINWYTLQEADGQVAPKKKISVLILIFFFFGDKIILQKRTLICSSSLENYNDLMLKRLQSQEESEQREERVIKPAGKRLPLKVERKFEKISRKKQSSKLTKKQNLGNIEPKPTQLQIQFSKQGFSISKTRQSLQKIQELFKEVKEFSQVPDAHLGGLSWAQLCRQIANKTEENLFLIKKEESYFLASQNELLKITKEDALVWQTISEILEKMKTGASGPGLEGLIIDELTQARKILSKTHILNQKNQYEEFIESDMEKLCQKYWSVLAIKTFEMAFDQNQIDQMNYFRYKEYQEGHSQTYKPFTNKLQWKQFINRRRVKLRKSDLHILHVGCQNCMSPYNQPTNRIITCPECHWRYHQLCLDLTQVKRCGRCIHSRLTNENKQTIPDCFLCGVTGVGTSKISRSRFAHVFCLLAHKIWTIEGKKITAIKQVLPEDQKIMCQLCFKQTSFMGSCKKCRKQMHPLCAFFNGYRLQLDTDHNIQIYCCEKDEGQREKLQKKRKFILNYQKYVFEQTESTKTYQKKKKR